MKDISTVKIPAPAIKDNGAVRIGMFTPPFPPVHARPVTVGDKVRSFSPPLPAPRAK